MLGILGCVLVNLAALALCFGIEVFALHASLYDSNPDPQAFLTIAVLLLAPVLVPDLLCENLLRVVPSELLIDFCGRFFAIIIAIVYTLGFHLLAHHVAAMVPRDEKDGNSTQSEQTTE